MRERARLPPCNRGRSYRTLNLFTILPGAGNPRLCAGEPSARGFLILFSEFMRWGSIEIGAMIDFYPKAVDEFLGAREKCVQRVIRKKNIGIHIRIPVIEIPIMDPAARPVHLDHGRPRKILHHQTSV